MEKSFTVGQADKNLAEIFQKNSRYNALILLVAGIGFIVIYFLALFNILGEPAPQLLYIAGSIFFLAISQPIVRSIAKRGRGIATNFTATILIGVFAMLLVSFWEGVGLIAIIVIVVTPTQAITNGLPRRYLLPLAGTTLIMLLGAGFANTNPFALVRLQTNSTTAIASLAFLTTTGILLLTTFIISQSTRFKSLQTQLLTSFSIIIIIPVIMTAVISAIGSYSNNQTQSLNTLRAVSTLKEDQLTNLIAGIENDATKLINDVAFNKYSQQLLDPGTPDGPTKENARRIARNQMNNLLGLENEEYVEILILNVRGDVLVSSDLSSLSSEGLNFEGHPFYRQGLIKSYAGYVDFNAFGGNNLIVSLPLYGPDQRIIRGVLALRLSNDTVENVMRPTTGLEDIETYLINPSTSAPVTSTRFLTESVASQAVQEGTRPGFESSSGTYENYIGEQVLGYYTWYEPMQLLFISEIPVSVIAANSLRSITGSVIIAVVIVLIAFSAIIISAQSITEPIKSLVQTAQEFAIGNLAARAKINRADEIGTLGKAYNEVAAELADIVEKLEQRVSERTLELEGQTLRLRVAADIAKDAASARDLTELLDRAGRLILDRFEFYHTGIFLLDNNKEFAVLASSPTDAGRQMIMSGHKLRVGATGIVGRVAATGEPRISQDTEIDATYFNHAYLPNTKSEMALPLIVEKNIIGVLDVQSTESHAFTADDITIMQVLADQLATAIERTRLLQQVEQSLRELEQTYGQATIEGWRTLSESGLLAEVGYQFDNIRIQPIKNSPEQGYQAMQSGNTIFDPAKDGSKPNILAIPIKIRGKSIGAVTIKLKENYSPSTIQTLEQAIERLAGSLESARLFEEARLRADREQAIARITSSISSSSNFDNILRTTAEEIGKSFGDTEVTIQILGDLDDQQNRTE